MTTFQEPQPQSRRAVRQSERADAPEPPVAFAPFPPVEQPVAPQVYTPVPPAPGRRAAASAEPATAPAPEVLQFRPRGTASAPPPVAQQASGPAPVVQPPQFTPPPAAEQPGYRVRDFSPEGGRRAAQSPSWGEQSAPPAPQYDLNYQTEARLGYEVPVAPVSEIPQSIAQQFAPQAPPAEPQFWLADSAPGIPTEETLTRRELRALQRAEEMAANGGVEPQYDAVPQYDVAPQYDAVPQYHAAPMSPPLPPQPDTSAALTNAMSEFDLLARERQVTAAVQQLVPPPFQVDAPLPEPGIWTAPTGHWTTQLGLEGETQPYENTINRTVGSGSPTTSALVLPTIPGGVDIRGPLTSTGEIMLTGSIELPHSFSSTGATARFDHDGIDALFDASDAEVISTDSQPVRAIQAVSTHNSGQGVIHTQKPKGTRALTALVIAAASMAVIVVGLLVTAMVLNVF